MRAQVTAGMPEHERVSCRVVGLSLTLAQVAPLAFEGAPIDTLTG